MNRLSGHALVLAAGALSLPATAARGDTVVLEPIKDNTLFSTETTSNGAGDAVFSGQTGGGVKQRAVLAFQVSGRVPPGSTITSATLSLSLVQQSPGAPPQVHTLHRIRADWGEGASNSSGGAGAPAEPGDATWLHRFYPGLFWAAPGGDFVASGSSSQTVGGPLGTYTWPSTAQTVADVQGWLDDPATASGWLLKGNEVVLNSARKFQSREGADPALRPKLLIEFTQPVPCPWDCGGRDGDVGITDFLALLAQWGTSGGTCDLGLGKDGVGAEDFNDLLGHWGACP